MASSAPGDVINRINSSPGVLQAVVVVFEQPGHHGGRHRVSTDCEHHDGDECSEACDPNVHAWCCIDCASRIPQENSPCPGCETNVDADGYCTDAGCVNVGKVPER